jgi:CubicO group peptidase (beta-lactamase class C family)
LHGCAAVRESDRPHGTKFRYWDDAMMQFGSVLTKAAGGPLDQLFKTRIADPIGMTQEGERTVRPTHRPMWTGSGAASSADWLWSRSSEIGSETMRPAI